MRKMSISLKRKRGCGYCLDLIPWQKVGNTKKKAKCPHEECPYHEMDNTKTYDEYVESVSDMPIEELITLLLGTKQRKKQKVCLKKP